MLLLETETNVHSCRQSSPIEQQTIPATPEHSHPPLHHESSTTTKMVSSPLLPVQDELLLPSTASGATESSRVRNFIRRRSSTPSSTRLRSNLFQKLGIHPSVSSCTSGHTSAASTSSTCSRHTPLVSPSERSVLGNAKPLQIPLKYEHDCSKDDDDDDTTSNSKFATSSSPTDRVFHAWGSLWTRKLRSQEDESDLAGSSGTTTTDTSTTSNTNNTNHNKHVQFDDTVTVLPIPRREAYSKRYRQLLWDSPAEMQLKVVRNTVEFTADGWDWHAALEEEEHFYNPATGEYIHPVHLEIAQMPPEEQDLLVPDNYINPAVILPQQDNE